MASKGAIHAIRQRPSGTERRGSQSKDIGNDTTEGETPRGRKRKTFGNDLHASGDGATSNGIPLGQFYKYVSSEIEDEQNFASIGATMLLIISFVFVASGILRHDEVFAVQDSVWNDLVENANFAYVGPMGNKIFKDAHSVADFWSWMHVGAVPLIVQHQNAWSEAFPYAANATGTLLADAPSGAYTP